MKLLCPPHTCSLSIGGQEFSVDELGVATLPDEGDYVSLLPSGFSVMTPEQSADHETKIAAAKAEAEKKAQAEAEAAAQAEKQAAELKAKEEAEAAAKAEAEKKAKK